MGPSGKTVRPFLKRYFNKVGNYKEHISKIQANEINQSVAKINKAVENPRNSILAKVMSQTAFAQCSGLQDGNSEASNQRKKICELLNEDLPIEDRIRSAHKLLSEDYLLFLPSVLSFFSKNNANFYSEESQKALADLKADNALKLKMNEMFHSLSGVPNTALDILKLQKQLGWFDEKEFGKLAKKILKQKLKNYQQEDYNVICENNYLIGEVAVSDINPEALKDDRIVFLAGCLSSKDPKVTRAVLDRYAQLNPMVRSVAMASFIDLPGYEEEIKKLVSQGRQSSEEYLRRASIKYSFIRNIDGKGSEFGLELIRQGEESNIFQYLNKIDYTPSEQFWEGLIAKASGYNLAMVSSKLPLESSLWPQLIEKINPMSEQVVGYFLAVDDRVNSVIAEWALGKMLDDQYDQTQEGYFVDILSQYQLSNEQVQQLSHKLKQLMSTEDQSANSNMSSRDLRPAYIRQVLMAQDYDLDSDFIKKYIGGREITNYNCEWLDAQSSLCGG